MLFFISRIYLFYIFNTLHRVYCTKFTRQICCVFAELERYMMILRPKNNIIFMVPMRADSHIRDSVYIIFKCRIYVKCKRIIGKNILNSFVRFKCAYMWNRRRDIIPRGIMSRVNLDFVMLLNIKRVAHLPCRNF